MTGHGPPRYEVLAVYQSGYTVGDIQPDPYGQNHTVPETRDSSAPRAYHLATVTAEGPKHAVGKAIQTVLERASSRNCHPDWARRVTHARDADYFRAVAAGKTTDVELSGPPLEKPELQEYGMAQVFEPDSLPEQPREALIEQPMEVEHGRVLPPDDEEGQLEPGDSSEQTEE